MGKRVNYEDRKRRSLTWLHSVFLAFSTVGAVVGGLIFNASGGSALAPCFLAPSIAGVLLIPRAYHEGRLSRKSAPHKSGAI